ncbi:hypothetical protein CEUSTIGMA_g5657.t1 [Chlamydomonas eustigma]|uniref:Uncharacterized protein n=1 Tax=Chlamydomonas eustigma TaxID=1157962 RepID=A0A250X557_9CHLO|nr:hypothetical protein CEUSTIGMA_g5657.t1 [Chlamydomonas eustigma]|eukprot:GAX78215.1 hypothetical protein CEUSTIGMA_g5657.t1 [Chlamydomonas eustigma]
MLKSCAFPCQYPVALKSLKHPSLPVSVLRCSCSKAAGDGMNSEQQESYSFRSNLRKGFAPQKREKQIKPQSAPSTSAEGPLVLGADEFSMDKWREVDKKMNKYPGMRTFTAIGSGGAEFGDAMVKAVEHVVGTVHPECVTLRPSSKGAYVSVKVGPVPVSTPDQVIEIFAKMKVDNRLKWFL